MGFIYGNEKETSGGTGGTSGVTSVNGKTGIVLLSAIDIRFDNSGTNLTSSNIQNAIKELNSIIEHNKEKIEDIISGNIETGTQQGECEGKVKVNDLDELGFLDTKIDNKTIAVANDKLVAKTLEGLNATKEELNFLTGAKSNIQAQINSLSQVGSFIGAVDTKAELDALMGVRINDIVIVIVDETRGSASTIYMYDGRNWIYVGEFKVELRDFTTNPINLETEVIGVLPKDKIDSSIVTNTDLNLELINKLGVSGGKLTYENTPVGIENEVLSVNGKKGIVVLNEKDIGAVANVLNSCSGIQIGTLANRPLTTKDNLLYIVMDKTPNEFYRYDDVMKKWQLIGSTTTSSEGSGGSCSCTGGGENSIALQIQFDNTGTGLRSVNLQSLGVELNNLIKENKNRIDELAKDRDRINNLELDKGKVKLDASDTLSYLNNKIDGVTITTSNKKLTVRTLDGLNATVNDLNNIKGVRSNIQEQIDSLTSIGNFIGAVETKDDLITVTSPSNKDIIIVTNDDSRQGATTMYMYNGSDWIYISDFNIEMRNFNTNPIKLESEVTGILPYSKVEHRDFSVNPINLETDVIGVLPSSKIETRNFKTNPINLSNETIGVLPINKIDSRVVSNSDINVSLLNGFHIENDKLMYGTNEVNLSPYGDHRLVLAEF